MIAEQDNKAAIAARLAEAFTAIGIQEGRGRHQRIADEFGVSRETARKWEAAEAIPEMWRLSEISKRSGYSVQHLLAADSDNGTREEPATYGRELEAGPSITGRLPIISWVQAGSWANVADPFQPGVADEWKPVTRKYSRKAYCLRVRGDSMQAAEGPSFPEGSIICIEPELPPTHRSFVIVRLDDSEEATFKQLIIDGDRRYLKPLNPRYPILPIDKPATFCGVVRQLLMDFG